MTPSNLKPDFDGAFKELGQKLSSFDDFFRKEIPTSFESFDPSINKDKFLKEYSKKNSVIENISDTIAQLIIEKAHEMGKIAYHDRMKEIEVNQTTPIFSVSEEVREKAKEDAAGLIREGKEPLTIKIWRHSHLASVHPHHKKMHGKAVPIDMNFIYENKKGEKFQTPNPHDKSLPESEKTECRCSTVTKVLFKTPSEIAEIRTRAATTGGYTDPEWAIK
jgi:hypothetical protein